MTRTLSLLCEASDNNNHKIIIQDNVYGTCCRHGRAIARVHLVHLMNVERRQAAADPRRRRL